MAPTEGDGVPIWQVRLGFLLPVQGERILILPRLPAVAD